jgi:ankyrin repeat protein
MGRAVRTMLRAAPGAASVADAEGLAPLAAAVILDDAVLVEALLAGGVYVDAQDLAGRTALMESVDATVGGTHRVRPHLTRALLEARASVGLQDESGRSAVWHALRGGGSEGQARAQLRLLLQAGADAFASDDDDMTLFIYAAGDREVGQSMVRYLLEEMQRLGVF